MSHSEWELMANSEDIEPGDWVIVENEDGSTQKLQYVKCKGGCVILRDRKGELFKFSSDSLEESEGERIITGKV